MSTPLNNALDLCFDDVRNALAYALNLDPADGEISPQWARKAARALTQATEHCWHSYPWPELCVTLTALTLGASSRPDDRLLAPGWELLGVYDEDPEAAWAADEDAKLVPFRIDSFGRVLLQSDVLTPYYYVRLAAPEFDATDWSATVDYHEGRGVYTAPGVSGREGQCWKAMTGSLNELPPLYTQWGYSATIVLDSYYRAYGLLWRCTAGGQQDETTIPLTGSLWTDYFQVSHHFWAPQRVPVFLKEAVLAGAEAYMLRAQDGQVTAADHMKKACDKVLERLVLKRWHRQGQHRRGTLLTLD